MVMTDPCSSEGASEPRVPFLAWLGLPVAESIFSQRNLMFFNLNPNVGATGIDGAVWLALHP